ncbi:unnamed protein product [Toxocara canis]|uniref:BAR domain-containing protein n=1 Tax=Toxocara canis TaxID=6265 RepID=A0A183VD22_TOXCA|nr:unnamed protein product [Toxocara canis]
MPRSQFVEKLRQFKSSGEDLPRQISAAFKPVADLFNAYSAQLDNLQKRLMEPLEYLETSLKIRQIRAALQDFINMFSQADVVREVLAKAKQLSRDYKMPEVERKLHEIEGNRQQYEAKAVQLYNKAKDILLDKLAVNALADLTAHIVEHMTGETFDDIELEKRWHDRLGPGEFEAEVTVPHGANSLREIIEDLHPSRFIALKSALAEKAQFLATHPDVCF